MIKEKRIVTSSNQLQVLPQPLESDHPVVHIKYNKSESAAVIITDVQGTIIYKANSRIADGVQIIKLSQDIEPGVYFLYMHTTSEELMRKIIITK